MGDLIVLASVRQEQRLRAFAMAFRREGYTHEELVAALAVVNDGEYALPKDRLAAVVRL